MIDHPNFDRLDAPVAVVGIGCRFPPDCHDAESFWDYLERGGDAIVACPPGRWDHAPARRGGFLQGSFPGGFDAPFFEISPREARDMDPQQRLLLECCWKALEDAAWPAAKLRGRAIGTYIGITTGDYQGATLWDAVAPPDLYTATGSTFASAAGRVAYTFAFEGPALALDTACSSSLVAIHLACQALRTGDCDAALAGGVNALLAPNTFACLDTMGLLAPDGEGKSFDASANGYVRGEGCGVVVLKLLDAAIRDGDRVLAICRGSAVNQNGRGGSLTAPSAVAQANLIRRALERAGLAPGDIDYIEAHGTGTPRGDVIELNTLLDVFGPGRQNGSPLRIGSVKSNIGHLEAGAGIAGFIKTVLCLQHGRIPPQIRVQHLNPAVQWADGTADISTTSTGWPRNGGVRRAGVSSFGFAGTNAHVILEEGVPAPDSSAGPDVHLLPISARTPKALEQLALRYRDYLRRPGLELHDVCYTAACGRSHFAHRLAVVGSTAAEMVQQLDGQSESTRDHALAKLYAAGADVDWESVYRSDPGRRISLPAYPFERRHYYREFRAASVPANGDDLQRLSDAVEHAGKDTLGAVNHVACTVLGKDRAERLDDDLPLVEQGFSSLDAVELRARLERLAGTPLPVTLLYNYPSLRRIADFLGRRQAAPAPALPALKNPPAPTADDEFDFLDSLEASELAALIESDLNT